MKITLKKITSLTLLIDIIGILITSLVLFIVPHGRVAYWSNWEFWGMTKTQWTNIHMNLGFLFILFTILHFYFNWNPILSYLKNKSREFKLVTKEFVISLALVMMTFIGTYFMIPPFSTVINFSESIKDKASIKYGEPPYGHAELSSFKSFCKKTNLDLKDARERLKRKGIILKSLNQKIENIASDNGISPQGLYDIMKGKEKNNLKMSIPSDPPSGTGNMSLAELCTKYNLNTEKIIRKLKKQNIIVHPDESIKKISQNNRMNPHDLYSLIYQIVSVGK